MSEAPPRPSPTKEDLPPSSEGDTAPLEQQGVAHVSSWCNGPHVTHYSGEDLLSRNLLTQNLLTQNLLTHNLITHNILAKDVDNERILRESLITNELQTRERLAAAVAEGEEDPHRRGSRPPQQFSTLKRGAFRQHSNQQHISEVSECSDSSGDRSSSLFVEVDSDRHSISDVDRQSITDRINEDGLPTSASYQCLDIDRIARTKSGEILPSISAPLDQLSHRRSLIGSQSLDEARTSSAQELKRIPKQLSEVIPDSAYLEQNFPGEIAQNSSSKPDTVKPLKLTTEKRVQSTSTTSIANGPDLGRRTIECQTDIIIADVKVASGIVPAVHRHTTQSGTQTIPLTEGAYRTVSGDTFTLSPSYKDPNSAPPKTDGPVSLVNNVVPPSTTCSSTSSPRTSTPTLQSTTSSTSTLLSNPSTASTLPCSNSSLQPYATDGKMTVAQVFSLFSPFFFFSFSFSFFLLSFFSFYPSISFILFSIHNFLCITSLSIFLLVFPLFNFPFIFFMYCFQYFVSTVAIHWFLCIHFPWFGISPCIYLIALFLPNWYAWLKYFKNSLF